MEILIEGRKATNTVVEFNRLEHNQKKEGSSCDKKKTLILLCPKIAVNESPTNAYMACILYTGADMAFVYYNISTILSLR